MILQLYGARVTSIDYRWRLPDGSESALTIHLSPVTPSEGSE